MKMNALLVVFLTAAVPLSVLLMQRQADEDRERTVAEATRTISGILSEARERSRKECFLNRLAYFY